MRGASAAIVAVALLLGVQVPHIARAAIVISVPADYGTIQAAIDAAAPGDTIEVAPGTYYEHISIGKSVTLRSAAGPDTTIVDGSGSAGVVTVTAAAVATIQGFTLQHGGGNFGGGGVRVMDNASATIDGNRIVDNNVCTRGAILVSYAAAVISNNVISGNRLTCSGGRGAGLYVDSPYLAVNIQNNLITDNVTLYGDAGGIYMSGPGLLDRNVIGANRATGGQGGGLWIGNYPTVVTNNLLTGNVASVGGGIALRSGQFQANPTIANNTIAANTADLGPGIYTSYWVATARILNNIITTDSSSAVVSCTANADPTPPQLSSNDVWNPSGAAYEGSCSGTTGTAGNVSVDPTFVDVTGGDYHLRPGSYLVDAGQNGDAPATDIDGDLRPLDGDGDGIAITDIGFDEVADPLLIDPASVDFGGVIVTTPAATASVTFTNYGSPVSISAVGLGGTNASDFSISSDTCTGATLAAGASCHVGLAFAPADIGTRSGTLTVTGTGVVGTRSIPLAGTGDDPLLVTPALDFGDVPMTTAATPKPAVVIDYGDAPVTVTAVSIEGTDAADFSIVSEDCTTAPIPVATACDVNVGFTPSTMGTHTATLKIAGPTPVGTRTVPLSGNGVSPPSGVAWGTTYAAGPAYTWNGGGSLARTVNGTTQRLHVLYATDRVGGKWATDTGPYAGVYYTSSSSGATWTSGKRLNPFTQHATRLGLAAAGSRVYATWVSQTKIVKYSPTAPRVLYVRVNKSYGASTAWASTIRLTSTSGRVDNPSIAAYGYDVYVAWTDSVTGSVKVAISHDRGVTWRTSSLGTTSLSTSSGKTGLPSVAVYGSAVVVGWIANSAGALRLRTSADRGSHWDASVTAASTSLGYFGVAVRGSRLGLAWTTPDDVVLRQRMSGAWGTPITIASLPAGTDPSPYAPVVTIQASNRIGVAWSEETTTPNESDLRWIESPDGGTLWFQPQTLASSTTSSSRRLNDFPSVLWPTESTRYVAWNGWSAGTTAYRLYMRKGIGTPVGPTLAAMPMTVSATTQALRIDLGAWRLGDRGLARR